jgi:hypothetical protein
MLTLYGLKRQNIVFEGICSFFLFSYIYFVLWIHSVFGLLTCALVYDLLPFLFLFSYIYFVLWIHSVFGLLTCALVYDLLPFLFLPKEFKNKTTFIGKDSFDQCIFYHLSFIWYYGYYYIENIFDFISGVQSFWAVWEERG